MEELSLHPPRKFSPPQSTVSERVAATNQQAVQPHRRKSLNTQDLHKLEPPSGSRARVACGLARSVIAKSSCLLSGPGLPIVLHERTRICAGRPAQPPYINGRGPSG